MLLPLSPDTVRNFLPQGAQLVIANNHFTSPSIVAHFYPVNMAPIRFVLELSYGDWIIKECKPNQPVECLRVHFCWVTDVA